MQLHNLMELVRTAEHLALFDATLSRKRGDSDARAYQELPPQEFEDFLKEVHELVHGVVKLKETDQ